MEFLTAVGQICTDTRRSSSCRRTSWACSTGPNRHRALGDGNDLVAEPCGLSGRVLNTEGTPMAHVKVDVEQRDDKGFCDVQQPDAQPSGNGRGLFSSRRRGRFRFCTSSPAITRSPPDGPVGRLLNATWQGGPYRPAHNSLHRAGTRACPPGLGRRLRSQARPHRRLRRVACRRARRARNGVQSLSATPGPTSSWPERRLSLDKCPSWRSGARRTSRNRRCLKPQIFAGTPHPQANIGECSERVSARPRNQEPWPRLQLSTACGENARSLDNRGRRALESNTADSRSAQETPQPAWEPQERSLPFFSLSERTVRPSYTSES
ncbi:hypothetical protein [Actinomadura bangladeshensis]|uniref:dioxygenase family protein n=1 Tax=Actinomadura bangladeshensis TaxID=453573 RepID=UPI003B8A5C39